MSSDDRAVSFGAVLAQLRTARGLSQSKLAEWSEFDHSYLSRLESGAREPSRDAVERLASAMNATPEERAMLMESAGFLAGVGINPAWVLDTITVLTDMQAYIAQLRKDLARLLPAQESEAA
jgi:transcriptional regulator with XRE-family HTH domain